MTEEGKDLAPIGVPQPVFGITQQQLSRIVAGNRAVLGLPPQRDPQAEQDHAEFVGWFAVQGYPSPEDRYDGDEMSAAFTAGMQAQRNLDAATSASHAATGLVDVHFVGNGPYPLQLVCLTEDASDVECGQEIAEVEPGATWGEVEAQISAHAIKCHADLAATVELPS